VKDSGHVDIVKPYDWTYTTTYSGTLRQPVNGHIFEPTGERIDIEKLRAPEPILFYNENVLYEDELADNGTAILFVKVRVMPSGFFALHRFFLRVDNVLFRMNDTRVYHEFGSDKITREFMSREQPYAKIRSLIPLHRREDVSQLTDIEWVSSKLPPADEIIVEKARVVSP
ncbi:3901_t:CDS:2, partial [Paraglomus occultum]